MKKKKYATSDYLSTEELSRGIKYFHKRMQPKMALLLEFGTKTLLRYGDLSRITWGDVLKQDVLIVIEKKTGKRREITIGKSLSNSIEQVYLLLKPKDLNQPIFNLSIQQVNRILKKLAIALKISRKNISTHSLRKSGSRFVWESNDYSSEVLIKLSQLLNHSSENITRRYLGISREEIKDLYIGFDEMF